MNPNAPTSQPPLTPRPLLRISEVISVVISYFTLGISTAVIHTNAGTAGLTTIAASVLVISATGTLAFAAVTAAGGSTVAGVLSGWLVTTRFGLLAAAVAPRLWANRGAKALAAAVALDPNVALTLYEPIENDTSKRVYVIVALALVVPWTAGSAVGVVVAERLGDINTWGLDAMLPALFLALIWPRLRERRLAVIGGAAGLVAVSLSQPLPAGVSLLLAALVSLGALVPRKGEGE